MFSIIKSHSFISDQTGLWQPAGVLTPHMKLPPNGTLSYLIRLAAFQASGAAYMKLQYIGGQRHQIYINSSWERLPAAKKSRFIAIIA